MENDREKHLSDESDLRQGLVEPGYIRYLSIWAGIVKVSDIFRIFSDLKKIKSYVDKNSNEFMI